MQKTFEYSTLMKRATLQQLFCLLLTHFVVLASPLQRKLLGERKHFPHFHHIQQVGKITRVCHFQPTQWLSQILHVTAWFKPYNTHEVLLQPWTTLIEPIGHGGASSVYSSPVRPEMENHAWFWAPLQERSVLAGESPDKNNENNWKP